MLPQWSLEWFLLTSSHPRPAQWPASSASKPNWSISSCGCGCARVFFPLGIDLEKPKCRTLKDRTHRKFPWFGLKSGSLRSYNCIETFLAMNVSKSREWMDGVVWEISRKQLQKPQHAVNLRKTYRGSPFLQKHLCFTFFWEMDFSGLSVGQMKT